MDAESFDAFYIAERRRVQASLRALSGDDDLAADCADEAFTRAAMRWDRLADVPWRGGWVYTTAVNVLRRAMRRRALERRLLPAFARPEAAPAHEDPDPGFWAAVRSLPPRQRDAVVLRYVADLSEADIARILNISRGSVSSALLAARTALRSTVDQPDHRVEAP